MTTCFEILQKAFATQVGINTMKQKVVLLACGSFNPPTNAHLRMFERARNHFEMIMNCKVLEGIISPVNDAYKKPGLISSVHRMHMLHLALKTSNWIRADDWECTRKEWCRTLIALCHFRDELILKYASNKQTNGLEASTPKKPCTSHTEPNLRLFMLCGSDFLESFSVPNLWSDEDIESIVRDFGLVVIYREGTNPYKYVNDHEILYKYQGNIIIIREWIVNEISSTKVRLALSRGESVRYLIPDSVLDYIEQHQLYMKVPRQHSSIAAGDSSSKDKNILTPQTTTSRSCL